MVLNDEEVNSNIVAVLKGEPLITPLIFLKTSAKFKKRYKNLFGYECFKRDNKNYREIQKMYQERSKYKHRKEKSKKMFEEFNKNGDSNKPQMG